MANVQVTIRLGRKARADFGKIYLATGLMRGRGEPAPAKPWEGAEGLEWEVPSPAPHHTFETPPKLDETATRVVG